MSVAAAWVGVPGVQSSCMSHRGGGRRRWAAAMGGESPVLRLSQVSPERVCQTLSNSTVSAVLAMDEWQQDRLCVLQQ